LLEGKRESTAVGIKNRRRREGGGLPEKRGKPNLTARARRGETTFREEKILQGERRHYYY